MYSELESVRSCRMDAGWISGLFLLQEEENWRTFLEDLLRAKTRQDRLKCFFARECLESSSFGSIVQMRGFNMCSRRNDKTATVGPR